MMTIDVSVLPAAELEDDSLWKGGADRYDYSRLSEDLRSQAMLAQGTVVEGLSSAVRRVVEAGQALSWAKAELPHGEYLPWVQQACGLKPQYASQLIKAAEWMSNVGRVQHLESITDAKVLFLLSADTTPEEVREWFMERCAAGQPPTRKEVQERKRTAGSPRKPQPAEALALSIIRKGEAERIRQAMQLVEQAATVTADQVMAEQRLRDLGKLRHIPGTEADFHRLKDDSWVRLPHAAAVEVVTVSETVCDPGPARSPDPEPTPWPAATQAWDAAPLLSLEAAAERLGMQRHTLTQSLTPCACQKRNGAPLIRNGYKVAREGRGMVRLTPVTP
jgi:hypothetical protein